MTYSKSNIYHDGNIAFHPTVKSDIIKVTQYETMSVRLSVLVSVI